MKFANDNAPMTYGVPFAHTSILLVSSDSTVSQGASYATKRIEALNSLIEIARVNPAIMQIAGDLIVKNMDWDGSEEIAERLKKMLPLKPSINKAANNERFIQNDLRTY